MGRVAPLQLLCGGRAQCPAAASVRLRWWRLGARLSASPPPYPTNTWRTSTRTCAKNLLHPSARVCACVYVFVLVPVWLFGWRRPDYWLRRLRRLRLRARRMLRSISHLLLWEMQQEVDNGYLGKNTNGVRGEWSSYVGNLFSSLAHARQNWGDVVGTLSKQHYAFP